MSAFRSSAFAFALVAATSASAEPSQPIAKQPMDIVPRPPSATTDGTTGGAPAVNPSSPPSDIEIDPLAPIDPETFGLYQADDGGLGLNTWEGTEKILAQKLLSRLPRGLNSAAMRDLIRRLLLSQSTPPRGPGEESFLTTRANSLAALGLMENKDFDAFVDTASATAGQYVSNRVRLENLLLAADYDQACDAAIKTSPDGRTIYWQKVMIFCDARSGDFAAAELGLNLLRERGDESDRAFDHLIEAVLGATPPREEGFGEMTALTLALVRVMDGEIPDDALDDAAPHILRAIAADESLPLEVRIDAGERAESFGALPAQDLISLYEKPRFETGEMANPSDTDKSGPMARALMFQAAKAQSVPVARAGALQAYWHLVRETQGWRGTSTAARVSSVMLLSLEPVPELIWFAADAIRALLASGHLNAAQNWLALLTATANTSVDASTSLTALTPVIGIAFGADAIPWTKESLAAWSQTMDADTNVQQRQGIQFLHILVSALGETLPAEIWMPLLDGPALEWTESPSPTIWRALDDAAADGRTGETILLAQLVLGRGEFNGVLPHGIAVSALHRVGLAQEARELALEAALAYGI